MLESEALRSISPKSNLPAVRLTGMGQTLHRGHPETVADQRLAQLRDAVFLLMFRMDQLVRRVQAGEPGVGGVQTKMPARTEHAKNLLEDSPRFLLRHVLDALAGDHQVDRPVSRITWRSLIDPRMY